MLSVDDRTGERTSQHAMSYTIGLVTFALAPFVLHMAGPVYLGGAILLGVIFLIYAFRFTRNLTVASARALFYYSLLYLPLLLGLMVLDKV